MELDADEQVTLNSKWSSDNSNESEFINTALVAKGKRTKRPRQHHTPLPQQERAVSTAIPTESASTSASISIAEEASAASAGSNITEEEEDMANCLILLAQGGLRNVEPNEDTTGIISQFSLTCKDTGVSVPEKLAEPTTTIAGKTGLFVYECKTCNKCFSSFQALGGHRASHKKLKLTTGATEDMKQIVDEDMLQISMNSLSKSLIDNKAGSKLKPKVHECSICGAEFNSGQALGGHMRRHRPLVAATVADHQSQQLTVNVKERSTLSLDLNLPAPVSDDCYDNSEFGFVTPWLAISN